MFQSIDLVKCFQKMYRFKDLSCTIVEVGWFKTKFVVTQTDIWPFLSPPPPPPPPPIQSVDSKESLQQQKES